MFVSPIIVRVPGLKPQLRLCAGRVIRCPSHKLTGERSRYRTYESPMRRISAAPWHGEVRSRSEAPTELSKFLPSALPGIREMICVVTGVRDATWSDGLVACDRPNNTSTMK
ncbi:hypothetical protein N7510_005957 [Penicillium lagena]|uniref:uncharacterized protein n=1 Tax=Penicillium lagena TaxID=94218 RepID=UPI0025402EBD|nr:uncharacterized protein N7510_005957 [Penicillium lagena]KAJ5612763.1 hypothetical protein N7510_005957 [Penicillium lagena]